MTLREADLTNKYKVIVLTTVHVENETTKEGTTKLSKEASGIAKSDTVLMENDLLVLFGELSNIKNLIQKG
ncbi:Uncharacterised protein [Mycobacterium tuberculosis]|jgi:trk system potassium uptake protein TrkA|nr:Uncharacterised protein [Mycobacterium tuberculosis]